jgi:ATP-binding cassette subfamily C protein CydC
MKPVPRTTNANPLPIRGALHPLSAREAQALPANAQARADLWRLLVLFMPYWRWMLGGVLLSLATLLANLSLMAVAGWFISAMALAGTAGVAMDYFTPAAMIRGFAIVRTGGRYAERLVTHEATFRLLAQLRVWFYEHLEPLAPAALQSYRGADLVGRIQADIESLNHVYLRVFVPLAAAALATLAVVTCLVFYSPAVAVLSLVFLLLAGVALPVLMYLRGRGPGQRIVELRAALRETVIDDLQGMAELRVYGAQLRHTQATDALSAQLIAAQTEMSRLSGFAQACLIGCATLAMWGTLWFAVPQVGSTLDGPDLALLTFLVLASFEAVQPLPLALQMLGETLAAARRIFALVDTPPLIPPLVGPRPEPEGTGLQLRGVGMRYRAEGRWALHDIDLDLPAGRRLAVVGASGAGKSSLVNLLLRFRDYQAGSITLGGVELRELDPQLIRSRIAVVSQDSYIFNASVRDNLLLAQPDASLEALEDACRRAQIHDFIESLPDGYDTELGEAGVRFSGGQARRLAIARALLMDAPLLILDEPTEGLDTVTEHAILHTLMHAMAGRSVLLITHRLPALGGWSSSGLVDEVIVLDQGTVIERGPLQVLQHAHGAYQMMQDAFSQPA